MIIMKKDKLEKVESLLSEARENLKEAMSDDDRELDEFDIRNAYLSEFERVCKRFDVEVELEEEMSKDDVYSEWKDHVNMSAAELQKWSKNPCSRQASQDPEAVIKRNLRLLEKDKEDWTENDVKDAKRTISFISRMSDEAMRPDSPREGPHGCPSKWAISLLNWVYNPFDSVPSPGSEVKNDLEAVEKITLSTEMSESRKASTIVHGDQEKHLGADNEDEDDSVQVPPVAIHKVESGSKVEVSDDVEEVLDELWEQNSD